MKLYKITFNETSFDQYYSFVVRAVDENAVVALIKKEVKYAEHEEDPSINWKAGYTIKEILTNGEEEIIDSSFFSA